MGQENGYEETKNERAINPDAGLQNDAREDKHCEVGEEYV